MQTITTEAHVGADGILRIEVPIGMTDMIFDVVIVAQPRTNGLAKPLSLQQLIGSIDDPTFVRLPQGDYPERRSFE